MKTVLLDCRFWGPEYTGLGRYAQELVQAMIGLKPNFRLVLLSAKKIAGAETVITGIKPYSLAEQWQLPKLIGSIRPDLTHFLHFNAPFNFSLPFVVTIHDLIKHHSRGLATTTHWPGTYWLKRAGYYLVVRRAITRSARIIVPSRWVKQDIRQYYPVPSDKIEVIGEAANRQYFKPQKKTALANLPKQYFIYVGNAYPHKNVIQLIKAVKAVAETYPGLKLVIVTGRDWFYQRLRRLITQLGAQKTVKLKDFASDQELARLYRSALAFVTASFYEGFGLPGLEAMAAKTLVLASNRSALPDVYGPAAEYFNPDNLGEMIKKMKQVINLSDRQRQRQIDRGYRYAGGFSWQDSARKTLKVYENCFGV